MRTHAAGSSNSQSPIDLPQRFERLKEQVLVKRPILQNIIRKQGSKKLLEYANEFVDVNLNPPIVHRQNEFLSTIHEATTERFGPDTAASVVRQMESYYFASTADHVGPIVHPFFVNADLLIASAVSTHADPALQHVIVLACSNISLNNSSFPRGLLFHTYTKGQLKQHRLSFLPSNAHASSVYTFRPYTAQEIAKVQKLLQEKVREGDIPVSIGEKVRTIIEEIYNQPEIFACQSYREQVGKTNKHLWGRFFAASNAKIPSLIYLDQEDIVIRLLTKYHLTQDTVLNHILFDPRYEPYINEYFEGIFGSFSRQDSTGTYLFWARPPGSKLNLQLWRKDNALVTSDGSFRVELTPHALREAMASRQVIPNLLLNFMTLSFYYGLKCLGGFNQVNYLTLMKNAYIRMNVELGNYRSIEVCARAQTKEICDGPTLAFLSYAKDKVALCTGLDFILYGEKDSWEKLVALSKQMTLEEALNPLMPEIYRISYDEAEWEQDVLSVTEKDINQLTGLDRKVQACMTIHDS